MTQELTPEEALDRLRTIVDEKIGMQPVLGWDELLTLVEQKMGEDFRARHDLGSVAEAAYEHLIMYERQHGVPIKDPWAARLRAKLSYAVDRGWLSWLSEVT